MSREIASCHIEHYPDLMTCFQGGTTAENVKNTEDSFIAPSRLN